MQLTDPPTGGIAFSQGLVPLGQCTEALPVGRWPLFTHAIQAGFPSPADDYTEGRISLDEHLVQHKEATFFLRVEGDSMRDLGILNGDLLVVDKSLDPEHGNVVIAVVDGEFTVKQLQRTSGGWILHAANSSYKDIIIEEGQELTVWGVVRWAIHKVWGA